jgi:hypothetical protein
MVPLDMYRNRILLIELLLRNVCYYKWNVDQRRIVLVVIGSIFMQCEDPFVYNALK